jgi:hypothetical protein
MSEFECPDCTSRYATQIAADACCDDKFDRGYD